MHVHVDERAARSHRLHHLACRYNRVAFRRATPSTSRRLEGDGNSIFPYVPSDSVGPAPIVRQGRTAASGMARRRDFAASADALAGSFFERVFPGGISEHVSSG